MPMLISLVQDFMLFGTQAAERCEGFSLTPTPLPEGEGLLTPVCFMPFRALRKKGWG